MLHCPHCEYDFEPDTSENLGVYNAKTRILKAKCPECTKNFRLNREESDRLLEKFPELQNEMDQIKVEKGLSKDEPEEPPASDFEERFREALSIFGLNSKKYEPKIQAILKLIERTGASRDWLKYYLQKFSFTNKMNIDSIVDMVFIDEDANSPLPPHPFTGGNQNSGFVPQTLPGGQVILVPTGGAPAYPQSQQPIIIYPGGNQNERVTRHDDSDSSITEILGDDGKVTKRIIKGRVTRPNDSDSEDQTLKIINTLKDLGLFKPQGHSEETHTARIPDEIRDTLDSLESAITNLSMNLRDKPDKVQNDELQKMSSTIDSLTAKIDNYEKEKRDNESKAIRQEISDLKGLIRDISSGKNRGDTPSGLSDAQFETHTKHKSLETINESGQHIIDKITDPLNKILEGQQKISGLVTVRELERADGVAPGTYMKVLTPYAPPTDNQVKETVTKWQDKAANAAAVKKAGAPS